jgi:hypothetical protein
VAKEINPRLVFERLFLPDAGRTGSAALKRDQYRRSILDFVAEDARGLKGKLGSTDQHKLDEYLSSVREIEQRLNRVEKVDIKGLPPGTARPSGIPRNFEDYARLMADVLLLAFQTDQTRIATFVLANEGSNRPYREIGITEGHHELSHHGRVKAKMEKIQKINLFHVKQLAYLAERLKGVKEGEGTLLDNCLIVYGSGIGDGNRHNHDDLPVLLLGKGGGSIRTGRHLVYRRNTPLMNLYLSMLDRVGVPLERFGDSTGRLPGLEG